MAEALASAAAVSARAAGITDKPFSDNYGAEARQKVPLIMVGVNPQVPDNPQVTTKVYDIPSEEYTND